MRESGDSQVFRMSVSTTVKWINRGGNNEGARQHHAVFSQYSSLNDYAKHASSLVMYLGVEVGTVKAFEASLPSQVPGRERARFQRAIVAPPENNGK